MGSEVRWAARPVPLGPADGTKAEGDARDLIVSVAPRATSDRRDR